MTKFFFIGFLICLIFSESAAAQSEVRIGMSSDEFHKIYPNLKKTKYQDEVTYSRFDNFHGLEAEWGYRFKNNKLEWIYFSKYLDIDSINKENFVRCLNSTNAIIEAFTKAYGIPDTIINGDTTYIEPYKHYGYDVIEARWKDYEGMKVKVEFDFFGGKGEYHLIVGVNYFDKTYPYFD